MKMLKRSLFVLLSCTLVGNTYSAPPGSGNPPTADFTTSISPGMVAFTDASSDDGTVESWSWDFGDTVGTSTEQNPVYAYTAIDTYSVTLTVTDNSGNAGSVTKAVEITELISPTAEVASVKKDCGSTPDCFTTTNDMTKWLNNIRKPNQFAPLVVDIGPGTFAGIGLICAPVNPEVIGYVSIRGAGRGITQIDSGPGFGMVFDRCDSISVQDLTTRGSLAVLWQKGGSSNWNNVEMVGTRAAWYDSIDGGGATCPQEDIGNHNFFASTFRAENLGFPGLADAFFNACGDNWIRGSEIFLHVNAESPEPGSLNQGVLSKGAGNQVRLYGSNVRVITDADAGVSPSVQYGFSARQGGTIHFHGGEIVVRNENAANNGDVVSVWADGAGSRVHVVEVSYGLLPAGTGTATRVLTTNGGVANAPFQWPSSVLPPTPGDATGTKHLISEQGQDMYVETDCVSGTDSTSGCDSGAVGNEPHLMIYDTSCAIGSSGPWFDTVTNQCRGYVFPTQ